MILGVYMSILNTCFNIRFFYKTKVKLIDFGWWFFGCISPTQKMGNFWKFLVFLFLNLTYFSKILGKICEKYLCKKIEKRTLIWVYLITLILLKCWSTRKGITANVFNFHMTKLTNKLIIVIKQLGEEAFNHTHYVANSLSLILDKLTLKI